MKSIEKDFNEVTKNWHNIYQWTKCTKISYTEEISQLLLKQFDLIKWTGDGLRKNKFKQDLHIGYCQIDKDPNQFMEKRFCRALFNISLEHFGKIIDYEVPLTEPKQGQGKKNHGDIDLLSQKENSLFFIEVKKHKSAESLLKAILEIFVYTYRLHHFKMINSLKLDYGCSESTTIVPAVLTFSDSRSGNQIKEFYKYPELQNLLKRINAELNKEGIKNIEFYVVEEFIIEKALVSSLIRNKDYKIELSKPISIKKYNI
ncbi:hypothetical protein [Flavobacterium sp.]|uniref:hypothetical protein n=1 Tax=Flavobacterium sp. TaxID=239 RepID=UPI0025F4901B|nr:hypothetical protein [Flavobacterium sp.]